MRSVNKKAPFIFPDFSNVETQVYEKKDGWLATSSNEVQSTGVMTIFRCVFNNMYVSEI